MRFRHTGATLEHEQDREHSSDTATAVPEWAVDYINKWISILILHDWRIGVRLVSAADLDDARARVYVSPDIRRATIELCDEIPDEAGDDELDEWQRDIIHELVHVFTARMTTLVEDTILSRLGAEARDLMRDVWLREYEPVVEGLTSVLRRIEEGRSANV